MYDERPVQAFLVKRFGAERRKGWGGTSLGPIGFQMVSGKRLRGEMG